MNISRNLSIFVYSSHLSLDQIIFESAKYD